MEDRQQTVSVTTSGAIKAWLLAASLIVVWRMTAPLSVMVRWWLEERLYP